jgi:hypothetical protein
VANARVYNLCPFDNVMHRVGGDICPRRRRCSRRFIEWSVRTGGRAPAKYPPGKSTDSCSSTRDWRLLIAVRTQKWLNGRYTAAVLFRRLDDGKSST